MNDELFGVLRIPDQVLFGSGALDSLPTITASFGKRVLICADPFIATTGLFKAAVANLNSAGLTVQIMTEVVSELPIASVEDAAISARKFNPDVIIGFGGGSAIDLGKLVALLCTWRAPIRKYYGENMVPGSVLPLIAIPTTAGTGSEVTPVAVVSDPSYELKVGVSSPHLIPRFAIVDPRLTLGAPAQVAAFSGIDAFVHALECFTATAVAPKWREQLPVFVGRNSLSSVLALEAIRLIGHNLRAAVADSQSQQAHEAMAYGSLLAGMAFGSGGTHLSHALQYPIGALTKTPHGLGTGLMLPYVMQACMPVIGKQLVSVAEALDIGAEVVDKESGTLAAIGSLVWDIGIPRTLAEIGITRDQLPHIADLALNVSRLANNAPIDVTKPKLELILEAAWSGDLTLLPQ